MNTIDQNLVGKQGDEKIDELVKSAATILGDICARLEVVELIQAQESDQEVIRPGIISSPENNESANRNTITTEPENLRLPCGLPDMVTLLPTDLCKIDNFHDTEGGGGNLVYNWTGRANTTDIELLVSRNIVKELCVSDHRHSQERRPAIIGY